MSQQVTIAVHYDSEISNTQQGLTFGSRNTFAIRVRSDCSLSELHNKILEKLGVQGVKVISDMLYRMPISVCNGIVSYGGIEIKCDEDVILMFDCLAQFPEVRVIEVRVSLQDIGSSSRGLDSYPTDVGPSSIASSPTVAVSPTVGLSRMMTFDLNIRPPQVTFAEDEPVGTAANDIGTDQFDDLEGPNMETEDEPIDLDFDTNRSSSDDAPAERSNQPLYSQSFGQPSHYSSLDFNAMQLIPMPENHRAMIDVRGNFDNIELHLGQQFPNKEMALFCIKRFCIEKNIEYKVHESDQAKFYAKCKYSTMGCNWRIRVTYRRKKKGYGR